MKGQASESSSASSLSASPAHQCNKTITCCLSRSNSCRKASKKDEQWNRAIPEAGYITLGTLRYGVKLSNPKISNYISSSTLSSSVNNVNETDINSISSSKICDASVINDSRCSTENNCCCIGIVSSESESSSNNDITGGGSILSENRASWQNNSFANSTRLPVPTNLLAKNRTLSSSSSLTTKQSCTSQKVNGCLVIENRESSPLTCCYNNSQSSTINSQIINNSSKPSQQDPLQRNYYNNHLLSPGQKNIINNNKDRTINNNNRIIRSNISSATTTATTIKTTTSSSSSSSSLSPSSSSAISSSSSSVSSSLSSLKTPTFSHVNNNSKFENQVLINENTINFQKRKNRSSREEEKNSHLSHQPVFSSSVHSDQKEYDPKTTTSTLNECVSLKKINNSVENYIKKDGSGAVTASLNNSVDAKSNNQSVIVPNKNNKLELLKCFYTSNSAAANNNLNNDSDQNYRRRSSTTESSDKLFDISQQHKRSRSLLASAHHKNSIVKKLKPKFPKKNVILNFDECNVTDEKQNKIKIDQNIHENDFNDDDHYDQQLNVNENIVEENRHHDDNDCSFDVNLLKHTYSNGGGGNSIIYNSDTDDDFIYIDSTTTGRNNTAISDDNVERIPYDSSNHNKHCSDDSLKGKSFPSITSDSNELNNSEINVPNDESVKKYKTRNSNSDKYLILKVSNALVSPQQQSYLYPFTTTLPPRIQPKPLITPTIYTIPSTSIHKFSPVNCSQNNCYDNVRDDDDDEKLTFTPESIADINSIANVTKQKLNRFGHHQEYNNRASSVNNITMEKRRNTLDRWQLLGFGRRSASTPVESTKPSSEPVSTKKPETYKTERLKELTELLRGSRTSPAAQQPPPIPPPRKPRIAVTPHIVKSCSSEPQIASPVLYGPSSSITNQTDVKVLSDKSQKEAASPQIADTSNNLFTGSIKPNTSSIKIDNGRVPPLAQKEDDFFTALPKVESRTIVGSYTQKNIPYRSASFSQVDYSSGKYIRSAISALKVSLKKNREPTVVDNANLTLPRKKDSPPQRECSPISESAVDENEPTSTDKLDCIKKTEVNINLNYENPAVAICFETKNVPDVILTENPSLEKIETTDVLDADNNITVVEASEMTLDSVSENELSVMSSPPKEEYLQTATTCLIPVPVYECVVREWNAAESTSQWISAGADDCTKICEDDISPSSISDINSICAVATEVMEVEPSDADTDFTNSLIEDIVNKDVDCCVEDDQYRTLAIDNQKAKEFLEVFKDLPIEKIGEMIENDITSDTTIRKSVDENIPAISLTHPSNCSITDACSPTKEELIISNIDYVEVRKRNSNEDKQFSENIFKSSDADHRHQTSNEDKRRHDKSKRRKGIYIQWPAIDRPKSQDDVEPSTSCEVAPWTDDQEPIDKDKILTDFSTIDLAETGSDVDSKLENTFLMCKTPERSQTPVSFTGSLEPVTPDSEYSRIVWPTKDGHKQCLTCQSSEEKDEPPSCESTAVDKLATSPHTHQKITFMRVESISDNESDKTPPREYAGGQQSPAQNEKDLRRYSKRPLRGPYGQMLEAEMKKPTKLHYDEILEELNRPTKVSAEVSHKQHLPIPCHTRASSTPVHTSTDHSSKEMLQHNHKRFPSFVDSTDIKKETKKFFLDSLKDRSAKKSTLLSMDKNAKRSLSTGGNDKTSKRHLDEIRLSQAGRSSVDKKDSLEPPKSGSKKSLQASPELLAELLKGSSEKLVSEQRELNHSSYTSLPSAVLNCLDTRTHVVVELFNTEQSYVESLETVVLKYLNPLKLPENAGIIDAQTVDEIFLMVPAILNVHELFLDELRQRLDAWEPQQRVGDAFVEVFSKSTVLDVYTSFVNNWNRAKDAIRTTSSTRPAFSRFLETMAREHKGKLSLDNLLIKPVQKFPNYELILSRLIKHTNVDHPDQKPLQEALKLVHDILLHLNCKEREALENGQREATLRELEGVIEGITELVTNERHFLLFDLVAFPSGQAGRKERGFFLFSDLLVITSIKRRSGTIRKPNATCPGSVASTLDTNKYKFLMKISIDDLEIVKAKDENIEKTRREIEYLTKDFKKLQEILNITSSLRCYHQIVEDNIKDLQRDVQRQLSERQSNDSQLCLLELTLNSPNGIQHMSVVFSKPDKRTQWEQMFIESKQKLAASLEKYPVPEFLASIPIRKTRAGLQFTCAAPTLGQQKDVWVCNSDGYVGQVCVLSLVPEPTVTSCNGVCNARILCVASVPANLESSKRSISISIEDTTTKTQLTSEDIVAANKLHCSDTELHKNKSETGNIELDSSSSSEDSDNENQERPVSLKLKTTPHKTTATNPVNQQKQTQTIDPVHVASSYECSDHQQSTMWLGTEDGCIHVYNCTDNIRIKKNKIKIQHVSAVYSVLYLDNRVFVSLANGEIIVYRREQNGWNTTSPLTISLGTVSNPITRLINVHGKLWCSIQGIIKIVNTTTLQVENQFQISSDDKPITNMAVSNNHVWISVQNSANIKCYHSINYGFLFDVNLSLSVNKMLSNCDDIIRQHKAACLRVTSLLACKELIWVGTSAGVLLTISNHQSTVGGSETPTVTGIPFGHTGHVRFLTCVDYDKSDDAIKLNSNWHIISKAKPDSANILIISGGDGYEDFRNSNVNPMSEVAGREDSTNHLLLWQV